MKVKIAEQLKPGLLWNKHKHTVKTPTQVVMGGLMDIMRINNKGVK